MNFLATPKDLTWEPKVLRQEWWKKWPRQWWLGCRIRSSPLAPMKWQRWRFPLPTYNVLDFWFYSILFLFVKNLFKVKNSVISTSYEIANPTSIPSDNTAHKVFYCWKSTQLLDLHASQLKLKTGTILGDCCNCRLETIIRIRNSSIEIAVRLFESESDEYKQLSIFNRTHLRIFG